jgi:hypothetical protein
MSPERSHGPLSPSEAADLQTEQIPDEVFIAFNGLIARNLRGGRAFVFQKDVVEILEQQGIDRQQVYKTHWLDVEDSYRATGWDVKYDKPGFNETYEPNFTFIVKDEA